MVRIVLETHTSIGDEKIEYDKSSDFLQELSAYLEQIELEEKRNNFGKKLIVIRISDYEED
jgi:hypothetical protein